MSNLGKKRITQEQRDEIVRRKLAGERAVILAKEFGVSTSYVNMLKIQAVDPTRYEKKAKPLTKRLTPAELTEIDHILTTTSPADHGMRSYPRPRQWLMQHGIPLAEKLFNKQPSKRVVTEFMTPHTSKKLPFEFTRPTPPLPHHIDDIPPEFAEDPSYVAYYLSPICEQIAWRTYEIALKDYDERFAEGEQRHSDAAVAPPEITAQRAGPIGKHAQKKGSPFTAAKKRRR